MILRISNFLTEAEASFWRKYCNYAIKNPTIEVGLKVGTDRKQTAVDRNYYSVREEFHWMRKAKKIAEREFKEKLFYQKHSYCHIMHYHKVGQGLEWHAEPNIATVSVSINISPIWDYTGANLELKNYNEPLNYLDAIFYPSSHQHRVTDLKSGVKKSLVMWLPNEEQRCADS